MLSRHIKKVNIFLLVLILSVFVAISVLLEKIDTEVEKKVTEIISSLNVGYFAENLVQKIQDITSDNLYEDLKENPKKRELLEDYLSAVVTSTFRYIYVLYRDKDGNYRYLLDGSKSDKGSFDDPLGVDETKWNSVYKTKNSIIIKQDSISSLSMTFLQPIIKNNQVEAILAIDFSSELLNKFSSIIEPVKKLFLLLIVAVALLLVSLVVQYLTNYFIKKESMVDVLTKAYNRRFLRDFFQKNQFGDYVFAMMDIDHFKKINDTYGHNAGDKILQSVAKTIKSNIDKKDDALIRFGGEEFLLVLKKGDPRDKFCKEKIKKIHSSIKKKCFLCSEIKLHLTVSIGVVIYSERYKNIAEIIKRADERLYRAKKEGRDKIVFLDSNQTTPSEKLSLEVIKSALDSNRVFCEYQPIICLKTNKIEKYEALVRLYDENNKIYYPNSFLDVIANTNIYIEMTKRVFELAFEVIEQKKYHVSINLNLSDILDNVIYDTLLKILKNNSAYKNYLTLELLEYESLMMDIVSDRINTIKEYGVSIALDDFGTGYSNFEVIQKLNIDVLKIDGSLIKNIILSKKSFAIVEAICSFSKKNNIKTVAEFISSKELLESCQMINIDYGQGFYLSKPEKIII